MAHLVNFRSYEIPPRIFPKFYTSEPDISMPYQDRQGDEIRINPEQSGNNTAPSQEEIAFENNLYYANLSDKDYQSVEVEAIENRNMLETLLTDLYLDDPLPLCTKEQYREIMHYFALANDNVFTRIRLMRETLNEDRTEYSDSIAYPISLKDVWYAYNGLPLLDIPSANSLYDRFLLLQERRLRQGRPLIDPEKRSVQPISDKFKIEDEVMIDQVKEKLVTDQNITIAAKIAGVLRRRVYKSINQNPFKKK